MNALKQQKQPSIWIAPRLAILCSAVFLLLATKLPVIAVKGMDAYDYANMARWAGTVGRFTLGGAILAALLPNLNAARLLLAFSVGLLFGPLLDMTMTSLNIAKSYAADCVDVTSYVTPLKGSWAAVAGLVFWIVDLVLLGVRALMLHKRHSS